MQRTTTSSSPLLDTRPHAITPPPVPDWGCPWQQSTTPTTLVATFAVGQRSTGCGSWPPHVPVFHPPSPAQDPHKRGPWQAQAYAHQQSRGFTQTKWQQPHRAVRNLFRSPSPLACKQHTTLPSDAQPFDRVDKGHTDTPHSLLTTTSTKWCSVRNECLSQSLQHSLDTRAARRAWQGACSYGLGHLWAGCGRDPSC